VISDAFKQRHGRDPHRSPSHTSYFPRVSNSGPTDCRIQHTTHSQHTLRSGNGQCYSVHPRRYRSKGPRISGDVRWCVPFSGGRINEFFSEFLFAPALNPHSGPSTVSHVDTPEAFIHAALNTSPNEPFRLPLHHLSLFCPMAVLDALYQELKGRYIPDPEGFNNASRPVLLITSAVLTTPNVHIGSSFVPYMLAIWVPRISCTYWSRDITANELDTLSFLVGTGVVSHRSKSQARSIALAHFNKLGRGPPFKGDDLSWGDFDQVLASFVQWLEMSGLRTSTMRRSLLQKLRLTPEYAGQFVLG
jgi:hypothetical protein